MSRKNIEGTSSYRKICCLYCNEIIPAVGFELDDDIEIFCDMDCAHTHDKIVSGDLD